MANIAIDWGAGQASDAALVGAEARCRAQLSLDPTAADALEFIACLDVRRGRPIAGWRGLERAYAVSGRPNNANLHIAALYAGAEYQNTQRFPEAAFCYRQSLELNPLQAETAFNLGSVLVALSQPDKAEACFRRAVMLKPEWAQAYRRFGGLRLQRGESSDALASSLRAGVLDPELAPALRGEVAAARRHLLFTQQTLEVLALQSRAGGGLDADARLVASRKIALTLVRLEEYFQHAFLTYGATNMGVSVHSGDYHRASLALLFRLLPADGGAWTVNDVGCGYGAMFDLLKNRLHPYGVRYFGYDISPTMVAKAREWVDDPRAAFVVSSVPLWPADYSMAAGLFNMNLDHDPDEWRAYMEGLLMKMAMTSRVAFSFNVLRSTYEHLFRIELEYITNFIRNNISEDFTIIDDYCDFEWTFHVRAPFKCQVLASPSP